MATAAPQRAKPLTMMTADAAIQRRRCFIRTQKDSKLVSVGIGCPDPKANVLFGILDESGGVGSLNLQDRAIDPFIIAIAAREALLWIAIYVEHPRRHTDRHISRHADVGKGLIRHLYFEVRLELIPPQRRE